MSNWNGNARTNAFRVKNLDAFKAALSTAVGDGIKLEDGKLEGTVILLSNTDDGDFPRWQINHNEGDPAFDDVEFNVLRFIAEHLQEGEVAVAMCAGSERQRYVSGWAGAINHKSESVSIVLDDIYQLAVDKLSASPAHLTAATYYGDIYAATMTPTPDPDHDKVVIKWTAEDVHTALPQITTLVTEITDEQALELLGIAEKQLKDRSIEVGWDILTAAIDEADVLRVTGATP